MIPCERGPGLEAVSLIVVELMLVQSSFVSIASLLDGNLPRYPREGKTPQYMFTIHSTKRV
jgi:hypothetical protein